MARRAADSSLNASVRIAVLHGKEVFLREEHVRRLAAALREAHGEVETFQFDGETAELATVLDELRSYGLMQTHKIVIVDDADEFITRGENAAYRRAMERYAENPVDHATLVLRASAWRPGNFDKAVAKVGAILKCDPPDDAAATAWCINRAQAVHAVTIERPAAALLVERLGTSLTRLDSELAKLASMVEAGQPVTALAVAEVVGKSREEQAWDIQQAILSGRPGVALAKLRELMQISRAPSELLMWSLADLARKVHAVSCLLSQGASAGTAARDAKLWGPTRDPILSAAASHPPARWAQVLRECVRLDSRSKSGLASAERSLEGLAVTMADSVSGGLRR